MSYEITTWKTKKLNNLTVPLSAFYEGERKDWYPDQPVILDIATNKVRLDCGCGQDITGILKDGILTIDKFDMHGEGSGNFKYYVLDNALKKSKGELEATLIWEGGDSITKLSVIDGVFTETPMDI